MFDFFFSFLRCNGCIYFSNGTPCNGCIYFFLELVLLGTLGGLDGLLSSSDEEIRFDMMAKTVRMFV
jgi:hypothetical protein